MALRSSNMMDNRMSAAHTAEASFYCPSFGQANQEHTAIFGLGTILMVSIFVALILRTLIPLILLALWGPLNPKEHPDLVLS